MSFLRQWIVEAEKSTGRPSKRSILDKLPTLMRLANESSLHIHVSCQFFLIKILAHELSVSVKLIKIKPCKGKGFAFHYRTLLSYPREQSSQCCSLKVYVREMDFLHEGIEVGPNSLNSMFFLKTFVVTPCCNYI